MSAAFSAISCPKTIATLSFVSPKGTLHTEESVVAKRWLGVAQLSCHLNSRTKREELAFTLVCLQEGLQFTAA